MVGRGKNKSYLNSVCSTQRALITDTYSNACLCSDKQKKETFLSPKNTVCKKRKEKSSPVE